MVTSRAYRMAVCLAWRSLTPTCLLGSRASTLSKTWNGNYKIINSFYHFFSLALKKKKKKSSASQRVRQTQLDKYVQFGTTKQCFCESSLCRNLSHTFHTENNTGVRFFSAAQSPACPSLPACPPGTSPSSVKSSFLSLAFCHVTQTQKFGSSLNARAFPL